MSFAAPAPTPKKTRIVPLTREQLLSQNRGSLCVINTASLALGGSPSELFFTVNTPDSKEPQPITLVATWLPLDLSTMAPRAAFLRSRWFNHAMDRRLLVAISDADAQNILNSPGAREELARLGEKRNAVRESIRQQREDKSNATMIFGDSGTPMKAKDVLSQNSSGALSKMHDGGSMFEIEGSDTQQVVESTYVAHDNDVPVYNPGKITEDSVFTTLDTIPQVPTVSTVDPFFKNWAASLPKMNNSAAVAAIRSIGQFTLDQIQVISDSCNPAHPNIVSWAQKKLDAIRDE